MGVKALRGGYSTTPLLHYSTTPSLHHSTTPSLHYSTPSPSRYSPLSLRISNLLVPWLVKLITTPFLGSVALAASRNCLGFVTIFWLTSVITSPGLIPLRSA